ncbi:hypothetical protein ACHAP5_002670 [Fusarium lateritium]
MEPKKYLDRNPNNTDADWWCYDAPGNQYHEEHMHPRDDENNISIEDVLNLIPIQEDLVTDEDEVDEAQVTYLGYNPDGQPNLYEDEDFDEFPPAEQVITLYN